MNRQHVTLSWLIAQLVLLSACKEDPLQSGIEGSGITPSPAAITAFGEVTGLGSIVVNDVEYDLAGAAITINGASVRESDLAPGHVVIVEGERSVDGRRGVATRATAEVPIAGRVSTIDAGASRFTILGQTIAIDASTIIVDRIDESPLGGLEVGRDVEVSGFVDSSGLLHTTRIEPRRVSTPLLLTGHVTEVDTITQTFSINGQVVDYATATLQGFATPIAGARVRVTVSEFAQGTVIAEEVTLLDPRLPGEFGDAATVKGWVTRFRSADDFDVNGYPVVIDESASDGVDAVGLDSFVRVNGTLIADAVVRATNVRNLAVPPGRMVGSVTIDEVVWGLSGLLTPDGDFRLNIEERSAGSPVLGSGLGQLVGRFTSSTVGTGVLIGEGCALPSAGRFCRRGTPVHIELGATSSGTTDLFGRQVGAGGSGVIRVETESGEEVWPLDLGYSGSVAGFDYPSTLAELAGLYELHQAEFAYDSRVIMSVDSEGRLFFQSVATGCIGNGVISTHLKTVNLYDVKLKLEACSGSFAYLNADYEGLSTLESLTPWGYDYSVLSMWVSTVTGATTPTAITFWGQWWQ